MLVAAPLSLSLSLFLSSFSFSVFSLPLFSPVFCSFPRTPASAVTCCKTRPHKNSGCCASGVEHFILFLCLFVSEGALQRIGQIFISRDVPSAGHTVCFSSLRLFHLRLFLFFFFFIPTIEFFAQERAMSVYASDRFRRNVSLTNNKSTGNNPLTNYIEVR